MRWTEPKDRVVRAHWGKGKTAAEIGEMIGKNRCQVIGRARRLGLSEPKKTADPKRSIPKSAERRASLIPRPNGKRVISDADGCQWLEGEPRERRFCGAPTQERSSYCDHHHSICFVKHEDYVSEAA